MEPFQEKDEQELLDEVLIGETIKNRLNKPRKEVKFTWEGLKNALPLLETNPFDPQKIKRIRELAEGQDDPKEQDYIEGFEEIERSLIGGVQDLGYSVGSLLTEGIDLTVGRIPKDNTKFTEKLTEAYEENKIKEPETLVGALAKVGVQFGIPGGAIFKIGARGRAIAKAKEATQTLTKAQKATQIAKRAGYMAGVFGATDFLASDPETPTLALEKESEEDKSGTDLALTRFRNRLRFGAEGTLLGAGFSLMGKPAAVVGGLGLKYGIMKPAGLAIRAADFAVVNPLSFVLARTPGLKKATKTLREASSFTVEKLMNPILARNFKFEQLPKFEDWRLFSTADADPLKKRLKKLDNFLSAFRSVGDKTGLGYQLTAEAKREIKARSRTIEKYLESIEKKSYNLAKASENLYNTKTTSPASQDYYLDQVLSYFKGQKKLTALPIQLRTTAANLNKELIKTKETFAELLPTGELKDYMLDNIKSYMRKSYSVFTNPSYNPPKEVLEKSIDWVNKNVVQRNKDLRIEANKIPGKASAAVKERSFAEAMTKKIMQTTKQDNVDPLTILQNISKYDLRSDQILKTGEELPNVIKKLLGEENNLKASVLTTTSHAITQATNKKMIDRLARLGKEEGWLYGSREEGIRRGILDVGDNPIGKLKGLGLLRSDMSKLYGSKQVTQALRGTPGTLDGWMQNSIYRNILQFKVATQFGKTVLSPATQVRNVTSASMFPLANGHIGGKASVTESLKMVIDDIFGAGKIINEEALIKNLENKIRLGVIDENIVASELQAVMQEIKNTKGITSMDNLIRSLSDNKFLKGATRVYAGGDNLWKWYGHEYVKSQMKGMYKNVDDIARWTKEITDRPFQRTDTFTGKLKTFDQAVDEAAAWEIRNTYPTYSKVPQVIQDIRKLPFGNFVSFPAEMIRTTANIINIGAREASSSDPVLRQVGYRRLMGAFVTLGGANMAVGEIARNLTGIDEDQIEAYKRSLSAPWNSRATIIPINKWKDGVGKAINFSYFSPYDVVTQPIQAVFKTLEEGNLKQQDWQNVVFEMFLGEDGPIRKLTDPFISQSIALERVSDVLPTNILLGGRGGATKTGSKVYSENDEIGTKLQKSFGHILKGIEPGAFSTTRNIAEAITGDVSKGGVPKNLQDEMLALFSGIRIINVDVPRTMQYKITEYNRGKRGVTETEKLFSLQDYLTRGPEVLKQEFRDIQDEAYKVNKDFHFVIKDALEVGMPKKDLFKLLKKRGLSTRSAAFLMRGKNQPYTGYMQRMLKRIKDAQKIGKDQGKGKVNREYFFPVQDFKKIEREYRGKSLDPDQPVNRGIIDSIMDLFSERQTPQGEQIQTAQVQEIQTPPLPDSGEPKLVASAPQINQASGLTTTQEALLSPSEKIIAQRQRT